MSASWADVADSENTGSGSTNQNSHPSRPAYVPPHLRNKQVSSQPVAPLPANDRVGYGGPPSGPRWAPGASGGGGGGDGAYRADAGRPEYGYGGRGSSGWNNTSVGWDRREREVNPFDNVDAEPEPAFTEQDNTVINFDAYEDIPIVTSGDNVPPPVNPMWPI